MCLKHERKSAYMARKALILLALAFKGLSSAAGHTEREFFLDSLAYVACLNHGEVLAVAQQHRVGHAGETLAETKVVNSIKKIALAHAVITEKAVYLRREVKLRAGNILEVTDLYMSKVHASNSRFVICRPACRRRRLCPRLARCVWWRLCQAR